jgi:hypothetical protein
VIKKIAYRLLGLALLLISALTWFWMLVGFEIFFPAQVVVDLGRDAEWLHPGSARYADCVFHLRDHLWVLFLTAVLPQSRAPRTMRVRLPLRMRLDESQRLPVQRPRGAT